MVSCWLVACPSAGTRQRNATISNSMQEKNATFRNFLIRTDALALKMGVNVQDLPDFIGIARASLFCYRTGSRPISNKTWLKLALAETKAGISTAVEDALRPLSGDKMEEVWAALDNLPGDKEDIAAQEAVFFGVDIVGMSVRNHWILLEDELLSFFTKIKKSKDLTGFQDHDIPRLRKGLKLFHSQLKEYLDLVAGFNLHKKS